MDPATFMAILKVTELGLTYGVPLVRSTYEALFSGKTNITEEDLDILEASLKHPSEYMPRPDPQSAGG